MTALYTVGSPIEHLCYVVSLNILYATCHFHVRWFSTERYVSSSFSLSRLVCIWHDIFLVFDLSLFVSINRLCTLSLYLYHHIQLEAYALLYIKIIEKSHNICFVVGCYVLILLIIVLQNIQPFSKLAFIVNYIVLHKSSLLKVKVFLFSSINCLLK